MDSSYGGGVVTINWLDDSTLVHGLSWMPFGGEPTLSVMKTDRDGNVLKSKFLIHQDNYFRDGESTFDNKVVMTVGLALIPLLRIPSHLIVLLLVLMSHPEIM
jgi:hypothetical protein